MSPRTWTDEQRQARSEQMKARYAELNPTVEPEGPPEPLADPTDEFHVSEHTWLGPPGKSHFIPSWYKPHKSNWAVKQGGKSLGFHVKDVLSHRRWAIKGDGELLDQTEFERLYERYIAEISAKNVDPGTQHIPRVERYVDAKPDPRGGPGLVTINYDPNTSPPTEDNGQRYDPIRDVIWSLKDDLAKSARADKMDALLRMRRSGEISPEVFERELAVLEAEAAGIPTLTGAAGGPTDRA